MYHPGVTGLICSKEARLEKDFFFITTHTVSVHYTSSLHHMGFFIYFCIKFVYANCNCMPYRQSSLHTSLKKIAFCKFCKIIKYYSIVHQSG